MSGAGRGVGSYTCSDIVSIDGGLSGSAGEAGEVACLDCVGHGALAKSDGGLVLVVDSTEDVLLCATLGWAIDAQVGIAAEDSTELREALVLGPDGEEALVELVRAKGPAQKQLPQSEALSLHLVVASSFEHLE